MQRRRFIQTLLSSLGLAVTQAQAQRSSEQPAAQAVLVQQSALAGWQYYEGPQIWHRLDLHQPLELSLERDNPYDRNAVAVYWQGHKTGYLPRRENYAVAHMLSHGQRLSARIEALQASSNPWARMQLSVHLHPRASGGHGE